MLGTGTQGVHGQGKPKPRAQDPTGQQLTTQVHTGGSGPKQVALFLNDRHLGSLWRSLLGPLRLTPPRRLQRERQAARWQQKRCPQRQARPGNKRESKSRGRGLRAAAPYNPRVPGPVGQRAGRWPLPEFQAGSGKAKGPSPGELAPHPWRQRLDGRGLVATGASQVDPLVPVDFVGEHAAQPEGAVQRGLIERHAALAQAGGRLGLFRYGFGEERDGRGL